MTWQPGLPVVSEQDNRDWAQWRKDRKRHQQRQRRASNRRIDYYPGKLAEQVIDRLTGPRVGGDYSSVIDRIVMEWADQFG